MQSSLIALILIFLGMLPSSNFGTNLSNKLETQLLPKETPVPFENTLANVKKIPEKTATYNEASSDSQAAYFIDASSGEILLTKNQNEKLPIASITKLMTALIVVENTAPTDIVTVPNISVLPLDTTMGVTTGDKLTVSELLHGLLIESGADASQALAIHVSGTEEKFVALMNERSAKLGLKNTQFTNSIGHDDTANYGTASDIAIFAQIALTNPLISSIVAKPSYVATSVNGKKYYLSNTNKLLVDPNYKGIKTGTTFDAGQCLVSLYNDGKRNIIGVLLNSPDRFYETKQIIEWTKNNFAW